MDKKLISICVPVFNEEKNIETAYKRISAVMREEKEYDYEIVFFDDGSTDDSRNLIESICAEDNRVKSVFYSRNFGYSKTVFYAMQQAKGDCAIIIHCDMQNPPEVIPRLIEKWKQGADVVLGVKNRSRENKLMYFLRTLGYYIMNFVFGTKLVPHATEFELFDRSFISVLNHINVNMPFLRGYIYEYGKRIEKVYYTQDKRNAGKSHFNFRKYYDFAIGGIVASGGRFPRMIIAASAILLGLLLIEAIVFFAVFSSKMTGEAIILAVILHILIAAVLVGLIVSAFMFEYIIGIIGEVVEKPIIVEEKRIRY